MNAIAYRTYSSPLLGVEIVPIPTHFQKRATTPKALSALSPPFIVMIPKTLSLEYVPLASHTTWFNTLIPLLNYDSKRCDAIRFDGSRMGMKNEYDVR
jgi:hypothetical protein